MSAPRRGGRDAPRRIRFQWDYLVILEWADDEPDDLPDVEDVLPADFVERIEEWGDKMCGAYGEYYLDDLPPVATELAKRLEAEYCGFRQEIRELDFELDREPDRWPFNVLLPSRLPGASPAPRSAGTSSRSS